MQKKDIRSVFVFWTVFTRFLDVAIIFFDDESFISKKFKKSPEDSYSAESIYPQRILKNTFNINIDNYLDDELYSGDKFQYKFPENTNRLYH